MAPSKEFKNSIILEIINIYTKAGNINWDYLLNDIYRFMNQDVPLIKGHTERFKYIAETFLKLDPRAVEYLPYESYDNNQQDIVCMKILNKINIEYLMQCRRFLSSI